jgi:small subunit ribosomal protein S17
MKVYKGKVVSNKMSKTATVEVVRIVAHPIYKKRYKRSKTYHVHDEIGSSVGQTVKFIDCKPVSKLKKWKVIEVMDEKNEKPARTGSQKSKSAQKKSSKESKKTKKK